MGISESVVWLSSTWSNSGELEQAFDKARLLLFYDMYEVDGGS